MKSFRNFFILTLSVIGFMANAFAKTNLLFIDPKFQKTVPVYSLDASGKPGKEITSLIPGDMVSLKETRKINGKEWFIVRAKDISGKDMELALDSEYLGYPEKPVAFMAAKNARSIKVGGTESSTGVQSPGLDRAVCGVDEALCHSYKPGDDIEVEDAVLAMTTDGENPKPKWRNYYRGKDGWWTDSENTNRVDEMWSNIDETGENCESDGTKPITQGTSDEISEIVEASQKTAADQQLETVLDNIGDCHPMNKKGDYHSTVVNGTADKKLPKLYKEIKTAKGVEIVPADRGDWVAIDVMARTLYGEMASCFNKGKQYPETVAKVILNRVDFNNETKLGSRFIDPKSKSEKRNDMTNAIFKDWQFSVWNREDQARRMAMCPPSNPTKDYWKGEKPSPNEQKIWKEAVRIASESVLSGQTFRKRTKDLKALYYTSDFELSNKHYTPITNAKIGGKAIPLSRCVQLWSDNGLKKMAPQHGSIFHPFFQKVFFEVAGF